MGEELIRTIDAYRKNADAYHKTELSIDMSCFADKLIAMLAPGSSILDVGCGSGRDSKYFSDRGFNVTGIDLTPEFIDIASRYNPAATFRLRDMRNIESLNQSFDGLWSCASFLHIPASDAQGTLEGFNRILNPDGAMFLSVKKGEGEKTVPYMNSTERFYTFYSQEGIERLVRAAGFDVLENSISIGKDTFVNIYAKKN
jgi:2-polyprenyl-3-methyl-5-hydroxy-6-metoxy-1,4-benzoquinol methylase